MIVCLSDMLLDVLVLKVGKVVIAARIKTLKVHSIWDVTFLTNISNPVT